VQQYSNLIDIDLQHIWHPFTQHKLSDRPLLVTRAKGEFVYIDDNGSEKAIIDGVSSWWVNIHGHSNDYINEQIKTQLDKHQQIMFAGLTHEPAIKLTRELGKLLDPQLNKFFFSDNGSTATEVAIKMAVQYFYNQGQSQRNRIIALAGAYHGDTLGAMSASNHAAFREPFSSMVFPVSFIASPVDDEERCLRELEALLVSDSKHVAALIVEPLVQGAAGMRFYKAEVLTRMRQICDKYSVLLIADEVFTAFGRTGTNFAYEQANIVPDIICLSKALTGGYLPMGLTVSTSEIYDAFLSNDKYKTFFHGHSYTANSLACTAALASLELYQQERRLEDVYRINQAMRRNLTELSDLEIVRDLRILGAIAVVELKDDLGYFSDLSQTLSLSFIRRGILLRPLGNVLYFLPPYIISDSSLEYCLATIKQLIKETNDSI
jgi:adenosylmethionine---8-amino-7-oxononanoate aminotransferase